MPSYYNRLSQSLDIAGSATKTAAKTLSDENSSLGTQTSTGTGDNITGTAPDMTLTDAGASFTEADVGRWLTIAGATTGGNNGTFLIAGYTSGTVIDYYNAAGAAEAYTGTWTINEGYSLEDDLNFVRTDRKNIKGTTNYYDAIPTYERPTAVGTDVDANLTNIAGKTLDAKALVLNRVIRNQTTAEDDTLITLTDAGNMQWADATDTTGIPVHDGADAGQDLATYADIIDPSTGLGLLVSGKATGDITFVTGANTVDGETFVLDDGVNSAVTFEFDSDSSVTETNTLRAVDYTGSETAAEMMALGVAAVNDAPVLDITATAGAGAVMNLENDTPGTAGNVAITETVTDAGFLVNGMDGGSAYGGNRIYGRMQGGSATEPNSVEVAFRSVAPGSALSASVAYTWETNQPTAIDVYYPYRQRMDSMSDTDLRTTLTNGLIADAGLTEDITQIRAALGISDGDTSFAGLLTNITDYYVFSTVDSNPTAVDLFNALNDEIGDRNYTGSILTDGETVTESLQALSDAIGSSSFVRTIERLSALAPGGTAHTVPGSQSYTIDATYNGQYMTLYWRGVLRDPGPAASGNDYDETSTTTFTPYKSINANDHINYYIYS